MMIAAVMMAPRKGFRLRAGRRKRSRSRLDELTERTRREARAMSRRRRAEARRAVRPEQDLAVRLRGAALETGRRLRPLGAPVAAFFSWIGRPVARALLFVIQLIAALIAIVLEVGQLAVRWVGAVLLSAALIIVEATRAHVNPRSTVAFVGVCAAVGLGVSQFFDYHGVVVDAPGYAGELGAEVPAPITGTGDGRERPSLDPAARRGAGGDPDRGRLPRAAAARRRESPSAAWSGSPSRSRSTFRRASRSAGRGSRSPARRRRSCRDSGLRSPARRSSSSAAACSPTTLAV